MVKNTRWAISEDETAKLRKKLMINTKLHDTGTGTADCGQGKFVFQNAINRREFATNSCVTGKENAGCSRFMFCGAINMREPAKLASHGNRYRKQRKADYELGCRRNQCCACILRE